MIGRCDNPSFLENSGRDGEIVNERPSEKIISVSELSNEHARISGNKINSQIKELILQKVSTNQNSLTNPTSSSKPYKKKFLLPNSHSLHLFIFPVIWFEAMRDKLSLLITNSFHLSSFLFEAVRDNLSSLWPTLFATGNRRPIEKQRLDNRRRSY